MFNSTFNMLLLPRVFTASSNLTGRLELRINVARNENAMGNAVCAI